MISGGDIDIYLVAKNKHILLEVIDSNWDMTVMLMFGKGKVCYHLTLIWVGSLGVCFEVPLSKTP